MTKLMTQKQALHILKMGHSVFLTGAAGAGKTYVLNEYIKYLKTHNIFPAITASTGIAATHIGGQTIHSWSGIGILDKLDIYTLDKMEQNEKLYKRYQNVKVLIIDEISMLHASRLDMINTIFKKLLHSTKPFAGVQVIFCGDFFQLPPVVRGKFENTDTHFAYRSKAWTELNPVICYLTENYRHEDSELERLLNDIRFERDLEGVYEKLMNKIDHPTSPQPSPREREKPKHITADHIHKYIKKDSKDVVEKIRKELETPLLGRGRGEVGVVNYNKKETLKLYTHNQDVDFINIQKYNSLPEAKEYTFQMESEGKSHLVENLKNNCLAGEIINLKIGTKVMFVRNDMFQKYQNGTLGEVVDFDFGGMPVVQTHAGEKINVNTEKWEYLSDDGKKSLASITQIPLRYAWAITVHKSQGMTLDAAEIDLSKAFGSGMGYVALSRVRKLENINLLGLHPEALMMNQNVLEMDATFQDKSERASTALEKYLTLDQSIDEYVPTEELIKKQESFLLRSGGSLAEIEIKEAEKIEKKEKIKTIFLTLECIKEKLSLKEIAEKRNLTEGTILSHIEELLEAKEVSMRDIEYIIKENTKKYNLKEIKIIKEVLQEESALKIKKEKLANEHSIQADYTDLKLIRLDL